MTSESNQNVDESLLGRFLHNQKLKFFFKDTYIDAWKKGEGKDGITKYNWEKTPATPGNIRVAWCALNELQVYYASAPADVKTLRAAQGGFFGNLFGSFWDKVFQRMMGNPTKLETLAKFHASMKSQVPRLYTTVTNFFEKIDEIKREQDKENGAEPEDDKKKKKPNAKEGTAPGGATPPADGTSGTDGTNAPVNPEDETDIEKIAKGIHEDLGNLSDALGRYSDHIISKGGHGNLDANKINTDYNTWFGGLAAVNAFVADCKAAHEKDPDQFLKKIKNARNILNDAISRQNSEKCCAIATQLTQATVSNVEEILDAIIKSNASGGDGKGGKGEKAAKGDAASGIKRLYSVLSKVNDEILPNQITWDGKNLYSLKNIYRAEDSLYKVLVFCGSWVDSFLKGVQYDEEGERIADLTANEIMQELKGPCGPLFQSFQKELTSVNDNFAKSSGFGTLQESEMKQIREGIERLNEKDFNMRQKQMKRTNEALARLKMCMEMEEPVTETAPQDPAPEEPVTTEDNKEEADAIAGKLRKLADARKVREERIKKGKMKVIFGNEDKESANEALSRLFRFAEETEVKLAQPETQAVKEPNAEPKKEHLGIEVVFGEEVPSDRALKQLQNLVYDGEPPAVEVPVDEGAAPAQPQKKPEEDEVIQPEVITEAPGDPDDPNAADPNAAPAADPNTPPPPDPGAAMDVSDLGTPPDPAPDPTAAAPADPAAAGADPAMAGADPAAAGAPPADPTAAAPADPAAAGAAPVDPTAAAPAPDETQQNVAGEAPNAAGTENGEQNKYDIGVTKPYNAEGEELHLTDQEQEQLFTKINLLTKIPDLVNYGKYFYNITPENVSLDDIHYINDLYELSVKLGLLTDDFEGNNLLEKYDSYKYSVISKQPEQALINADAEQQAAGAVPAQQVAEGIRKVKTESGIEVEIHDAPGLVIAKDVKDYMDKKDDANAEAHGEITFKGTLDRVRGLGSLVTFTGVLFGYPVIKTLYVKRVGEKLAKKEAEEQLAKQGYKDVEILAIENIDPIDYLYHEYAGMRTLEDEFTREYMKQRMEKRVARSIKKLNESVESKSIIPQEFDDDIGKIVDNLNKEIMEDPTIDFSKEVGLPKMMVTKEDFEKCYVECPVTEDSDEDGNDCCQFCVTKNGANNLSRVLFSTNCQKLCKCLEGIASTYGMNLSAMAEGNNILEGVDKITLTFSR